MRVGCHGYVIASVVALALVAGNGIRAAEPAADIDPVTVSPTLYKVLLENEHVRVVEYSLKPGERDQWHTHPRKVSYVVNGGLLRITLEDGKTFVADEKAGNASWMEHLGRHYAQNIGTTTVRIVLVEIKDATAER